ncbi:sugar transferase [candidate division KSB1 bacterium]|nr:sugar transferase [candidate division KSB1 bacterium]
MSEFPEYLEKNIIDEAFIVWDSKTNKKQMDDILNLCLESGIVCHVPPDRVDSQIQYTMMNQFGNISLLTISKSRQYKNIFSPYKHWFDILFSILFIIILSPLFLMIALLIKITSRGPVFFVHKRIGYNKRIFNMIKFRTMIKEAEEMQEKLEELNEADGPVFKIANDPRITPVGKWLRKMSLDELPQLLNVLSGDMSLVGPRPLPLRDVYKIDQRWQKRRFSVLPGLTCFWQISRRYDMPFDEWARLDLYYIDHWSLWLDLKIILKTIPAVLKAKGQ